MLYLNENREAIKTRSACHRIVDIGIQAGVEWRAMTEAEKQPWVDRAKTLKDAYDARRAAQPANPFARRF